MTDVKKMAPEMENESLRDKVSTQAKLIDDLQATMETMRLALDDSRAGVFVNMYCAALRGGTENPFNDAKMGLEHFNSLFRQAATGGEVSDELH